MVRTVEPTEMWLLIRMLKISCAYRVRINDDDDDDDTTDIPLP